MRSRHAPALGVALWCMACGASVAPPPRPPAPVTDSDPEPARASSSDAATDDGVRYSARGWLGVEVKALSANDPGVVVRMVIRGSPAERAGIRVADRLLKLDGAPLADPVDVVRLVGARAPGARVGIVVQRGDTQRLLAVELGSAPDETGALRLTYVGASAPALVGLDAVQGSIEPTLAGLRGKVAVLEFWAPWCTVCRFLVPTLNDWHARYAAQGVALLGITMEPVASASMAAGQLGMDYPVASDHSGKTTLSYRANALPTLFLIDRRGVVRDVLVGYSSERLAELEITLNRLLDEP